MACIWRGNLTGFFALQVRGAYNYLEGHIHGGAYFRNFKVCPEKVKRKAYCFVLCYDNTIPQGEESASNTVEVSPYLVLI